MNFSWWSIAVYIMSARGNAELMHTCSKNDMFVFVERYEYISDY